MTDDSGIARRAAFCDFAYYRDFDAGSVFEFYEEGGFLEVRELGLWIKRRRFGAEDLAGGGITNMPGEGAVVGGRVS